MFPMKNKILLPLILLVLTIFSCDDRDDNLEAVNIRIKNVSAVAYDVVQINGDTENVHTDVASGALSDYFEYETAYAYASIVIETEEQTYTLQPIDYVGETPLPLGFYTYELNITEEGNSVELNLVVD
ncbi:hypothetical protein KLA_12619 [Cellulophaga geojensis KL-A]|nr:hypothetical protein KLA_12619 [Cellulophaga geojensis KL-A]